MVILDPDHLSIADQDTIEGFNLAKRLAAVPQEELAVSIITYEEQMRGWLAHPPKKHLCGCASPPIIPIL